MKGLSEEIELSIINALDGMVLSVDILEVGDDKLSTLVKSRLDSFSAIKELLVSWQNSPNAPSHEKLKGYIIELVGAGENSIEVLRKALKKKIDFSELEAEKYGNAIRSKPIILKAITDINAGNLELRNQIEADKFDLQERDFKRGFPEKFANQEFYPTKNYHKEWYDVETDSVMICPLGTKGEIITLDGLNIMLPKKPKQTEILYHRLPKEQQYWRRTEMPTGLTPDTEEAYTEFILKEFKRRREGLWFMNNGKAVYITPEHYMGMQWNQMADTGGYKDFRIAQANMYYFAKACLVDRRSVGMFFTKGRRTGFTEMAIDHIVELSTTTKNQKIGITSKSDTDAAVVFQKYSYVIQNLPFFFQPVVKGKIDDIKKMVFGKPSDNSRAAKKNKDTSTSDYLNTTVDYRATALLSYDSVKLNFYFGDEASKWEYLSYLEHWANIEPTMIQGGRVVGKAFIGSTLNPMKKGGEDFKKMDIGSNVLKRNENGSTSTGLYAYFLPAHQNAEDYTDKYGVCHTVVEKGKSFVNAQGELKLIGALQYFETDFKSKRLLGEKNYWNARRLNPITKIDAFRDESVSTLLNEEKINEQLDYNELYDTRKTLVRGNFSWENIQERSGDVIWTPTEKGRFLVGWLPTEDLRNKKIMKRNEFGHVCFHPLNDDLGAFGIDTYDQDSTQGSELESTENGSEYNGGSKGAMLGLTGTTLKNVPNNFFFLEYITRPQTAEIFFEDCLMACVFYGMPALIESNKMRLLMHFRNRGYRGYSINRFDKPMSKLSQTEKDLGGIPSSGADIITSHWTGLESYIDKYVGNYHQGQNDIAIREEGEMGSMPFERTLRDWAKFNVKDRTAFDASIASGYAVMAVNRRPYIDPKPPTSAVSIKFATYT
jgi:hypothetical protein